MVHHTVQEKYQDKLKIIIIQFIMLTYFLSVIMKDPVYCTSAQANFLKLKSKQKLRRHTIFQFSL